MSCDTVIPYMVEFSKRNPKREILFVTFEFNTYKNIRKNETIYSDIIRIGKLISLQRDASSQGYLYFVARTVFILLYITFRALFFKTVFIHFKALREKYFYFYYLINKKRTFFFESEPLTMNEVTARFHRQTGRHNKKNTKRVSAEYYDGTSNTWAGAKIAKEFNKELILVPPFKSTKFWNNHVRELSSLYFSDSSQFYEDEYVITYILGSVSDGDSYMINSKVGSYAFLIETLDALNKNTNDIKICIKPHYITDMTILKKVLSKYDSNKFIITNVSLSLLAVKSFFFIANYSTSAFVDPYFFNVPTIEYTLYSEKLDKLTKGKPLGNYTDFFIKHDRSMLAKTIKEIIMYKNNKNLDHGVLRHKTNELLSEQRIDYLVRKMSI